MTKEIQEVLEHFGLRTTEQKVYIALLGVDKTTLSPLSVATGLPTTTIQSILKRLVDLGIVRITKRKTRSVYEAVDPIILKTILERQLVEMSTIVPLLQKMKTRSVSQPKIRVYYRDRVADIFHEALAAKTKIVYEIVSAQDLQEILGEKFHFTKRRVQSGIHLKSLRVEKNEIKKYSKSIHQKELREAKFLPKELTFRSSVMFWDNTVAFFTTKSEGLAWTVESNATSEMMSQLFELLWTVSRRMETAY